MRKAALKTILEKQKPGVAAGDVRRKGIQKPGGKKFHREFFRILVSASFSIAAVSTLFSVTSLWLRMALSTNPLPVSFRMNKRSKPCRAPDCAGREIGRER